MQDPLQSVSVFGLGKLGACIAASLAKRGFDVLGIDIDAEKVAKLNAGEPPVDEPLLAETIAEGRSRLRASTQARDAVATQASFFIPPTPSLPDGSFDSEYLLRAMQSLAAVLREAGKKGHLFVCSSTTTPGAMTGVLIPMIERETGWKCGEGFHVCYNPEFIALGDVIRGLVAPDLVLIGESDEESGARLEAMYRRYNTNEPRIARMSIPSAELVKISVNSFITMKISFTNQLRMIAEQIPGTDIHTILDAVGADSRIGKKYLNAGVSFGGPCFPRDNRLVAYTARQLGLRAPLAEATDLVNEMTKERIFTDACAVAGEGAAVAVLGVAYKPNTYLTEESAGLDLARRLKRAGRRVIVHDFHSHPGNSPALHEFEFAGDLAALAQRADLAAAVLCCPWPGYRELQLPPTTRVLAYWKV